MNPFFFPSIGVDISDESFKFLRLKNKKGFREIEFFNVADLKKGIVEEGEIKDTKALAGELSKALKQYRSKTPYLILSLPEEKGFLRLIQIQRIPLSEVREALEFQLEEHVPYPPEELIFDYQILPEGSAAKNKMSIVVTAYPKAIVTAYMNTVESAGFVPIIFELESQAVARAVVPKGVEDAVLVGDIGRTRTTFSIVWHGIVHFTSTIKIGGRDIDRMLKDSLHVNEKEASEIKIGRGLDFNSEEIIKSLSPVLTGLKDEAERQMTFWNNRIAEGEKPITRGYLCGGDAHLNGLPEFLSRELGVPVERAHIWENLFDMSRDIPSMKAHTTLKYATAFGLALRGDENLFGEQL